MTRLVRLLSLLSLPSLALLMTPAIAAAGAIEPALEATLDSLPPGANATALVILAKQAPIADLDRQLDARSATRAERHEVVVRALQDAAASQSDLVTTLVAGMRAGRVAAYRTYWILNAVLVRAAPEMIRELAGRADVVEVRENPAVELIRPVSMEPAGNTRGIGVTPGVRAIRADQVWRDYGITGAGRMVANLDTGVDGTHPALMSRWRGNNGHPWQECWLDLLGTDTEYPVDSSTHGTHTMGTMTGLGAATGDTVGVAWGAQWIACNVIGEPANQQFNDDVLTAFQWIADPDGNPATVDDVPDVVQNSWGVKGGGYPNCYDYWWSVIDNCEAAGCAVTFSAGNEGPASRTIRNPANRATTPTNCFAVGAVDATHYGWPYPIASWSSRGPSDCDLSAVKPEVAAPGVDVYSSVPGGGYALGSGTSMAGPHAAGVIALMREANPDLSVSTAKTILLTTARDEGAPGNDNDYGYGFVDAYAAVTQALQGTGAIEGFVTNATNGGTPVVGALVSLRGTGARIPTDATGHYRGHVRPGTYTAVASDPSFAPESTTVVVTTGGDTRQDFSLRDIQGPSITNVTYPTTTRNPIGPYPITAVITDESAIAQAAFSYRVNGGAWNALSMAAHDSLYTAMIPGQIAGSVIDFYISSTDVGNNASVYPPGAPAAWVRFYVTVAVLVDDVETDHHWVLGWPGDTATDGIWVRDDPVGTWIGATPCQPEDDHTPPPGHICFVTKNGPPGYPPDYADVDGGCTSLVSPVLDLSGAARAFVYYWRWFAQFATPDDNFTVQASSDNGVTWANLEVLTRCQNSWVGAYFDLTNVIQLTSTVRLRFVACDVGVDSIVEGAVDDITVEKLPAPPAGVGGNAAGGALATSLGRAQPNPTRAAARIAFTLASPGRASLDLFDASGRRVRRLADGVLAAGPHEIVWDGRDEAGAPVPAGVFFYRLRMGSWEQSSRVVVVP